MTTATPRPLDQLDPRPIRAIFTDLDDTMTDESKIEAGTFAALWELKRKGFHCIVVSGRPAGWADCLMRTWPLDAMIFENGAGLIVERHGRLETMTLAKGSTIAEQRARLESVFQRIQSQIPHLKLASDQPYRLFDFAIDYCEEPPRLSDIELSRVLAELAGESEITHKLSSIHVNYWYGKHTKVTAVEHWLDTQGKALGITKESSVFSGDSPNDEPLFEFFPHSVGVRNIEGFLPRMRTPPRFITAKARGAGFTELARHLCASR